VFANIDLLPDWLVCDGELKLEASLRHAGQGAGHAYTPQQPGSSSQREPQPAPGASFQHPSDFHLCSAKVEVFGSKDLSQAGKLRRQTDFKQLIQLVEAGINLHVLNACLANSKPM
jgi:hypothetical protein